MSWRDIPGWTSFQNIYDQAVEEAQDGAVFVEVGVAFGRSLAYLARKVIDSKKDIAVYGVDLWPHEWGGQAGATHMTSPTPAWGSEHAPLVAACGGPWRAFVQQMMMHAPEEFELVRCIRASSPQAARMFTLESVDMVMIDANHTRSGVTADINAWAIKVKRGGIIAGDDHSDEHFPGVRQACESIFGIGGYEILVDENNWPIWRRRM